MVTLIGTKDEIIALLNNDLINCPKDKNIISNCHSEIDTCWGCVANSLRVKLFYTDET